MSTPAEMRKTIALFESSISEARKVGDPEVAYIEKKTNNVTEEVVAKLRGSQSGVAKKLAKKYDQINRINKKLTVIRKELNEKATEFVQGYFNVQVDTCTKVIQTVEDDTVGIAELVLSADTSRTAVKVDYEAIMEELIQTLPEAEQILETLVKKYTSVNTTQVKPALRSKLNAVPREYDESVEVTESGDQLLDKLKAMTAEFAADVDAIKERHSLV